MKKGKAQTKEGYVLYKFVRSILLAITNPG